MGLGFAERLFHQHEAQEVALLAERTDQLFGDTEGGEYQRAGRIEHAVAVQVSMLAVCRGDSTQVIEFFRTSCGGLGDCATAPARASARSDAPLNSVQKAR